MWEKLKQLARRYDEIGELLEVLEPADVRAWLREQAQAVARRYAEDEPDTDPGAGA